MVALAAGTAFWGLREAVGVPEVRNVELLVPRLPKALDGLSIVQISDMHASPLLQSVWVNGLVDRINGLKPDLILFTGDMVDGSPAALDTLKELSAALGNDPNFATTVATQIGRKVDKVAGKGLSTEDYTSEEKAKLAEKAAKAAKKAGKEG